MLWIYLHADNLGISDRMMLCDNYVVNLKNVNTQKLFEIMSEVVDINYVHIVHKIISNLCHDANMMPRKQYSKFDETYRENILNVNDIDTTVDCAENLLMHVIQHKDICMGFINKKISIRKVINILIAFIIV